MMMDPILVQFSLDCSIFTHSAHFQTKNKNQMKKKTLFQSHIEIDEIGRTKTKKEKKHVKPHKTMSILK